MVIQVLAVFSLRSNNNPDSFAAATDVNPNLSMATMGSLLSRDKKGIYIDGHERSDVVEYQKLFLQKMEILESTHLPSPS